MPGDDTVARRRAAALAGHRGDAAAARRATLDDDATVRAAALGALARCDDLHVGDLERAAADPHAAVRRRAAELIGHHGPRRSDSEGADDGAADDALDRVVEILLADAAATVVDAAAWAAGERWGLDDDGEPTGAPPEALALLVDHARAHDDALVRETCVAALGAIGDPAGEAAVIEAMGGPAVLRRRAVLALAAFDGPDAAAALRTALDDRDWQVRQAAEDLLDARPQP